MNHRNIAIALSGLCVAVIASITTASAQDNEPRDIGAARSTAASAFGLSSLSDSGSVSHELYDSIAATTTRNEGVAALESIAEARYVGGEHRGITGAVVPQEDGGLCFELHQQDTLGAGGCVSSFSDAGLSGAQGVVGDQYSLMGIVAQDVSKLVLEFADASDVALSLDDGVYTWNRSVDMGPPVAIVTTRAGLDRRTALDLGPTLDAARSMRG